MIQGIFGAPKKPVVKVGDKEIPVMPVPTNPDAPKLTAEAFDRLFG